MPGPSLNPVAAQAQAQRQPLPVLGAGPGPIALGWKLVSSYVFLAAAVDTSSGGDILIPPAAPAFCIMWNARDTSGNNFASFGGMRLAVSGGAIDAGANYDWVDTSVGSVAPATALNSGNLVNVISSIVTEGGGTAAQVTCMGAIWFPRNSPSFKPYCHWQTAQDNITFGTGLVVRSGAGSYRFQGQVTRVRFLSLVNNLAAGTRFDLYAPLP